MHPTWQWLQPLRKIFRRLVAPLLIIVCGSLLLLFGIFARPLVVVQDIGSRAVTMTGLYAGEHNADFSYAYTTGDARLRCPQIGVGPFVLSLRMGGPIGALPLVAHLTLGSQQLALGRVAQLRVYQFLLPTGQNGNADIRVTSTTTTLTSDSRHLGVLLDWLRIRPAGLATPPLSALISVSCTLILLWFAMMQLNLGFRWQIMLSLLGSIMLLSSYALSRGKLELQAWWFPSLCLFVVAVLTLSHVEQYCSSMSLRNITAIFAMWRIGLWLIAAGGLWYSGQFYHVGHAITTSGSITDRTDFLRKVLATAWLHWDSGHYYSIARDGYTFSGQAPNIAFFPLYPLLMRLVAPLVGYDLGIAALLVAHLALLAALLMLFKVVIADFGHAVAYRTLVFLLIFPTSFFFVAGYTESLALALAVGAIWAIRRQRWWLAGLAGFFLALTRLPGVLVAPVLAVTYLQEHGWRWRALLRPNLLAVLLPPLGLALFMLFQWSHFGTPFAFLIAQQGWDNHIQAPWQTAYTLLTTAPTVPWRLKLLRILIWFGFLALALVSLRRLPLAYSLALLLFLIPPYLESNIDGVPRHVLLAFPAFILLAMLAKRPWIRLPMIGVMLFFVIESTLLFVNGFWIA